MYINFTKRLRDDIGAKFQFVLHNKKANYEGVINTKERLKNSSIGFLEQVLLVRLTRCSRTSNTMASMSLIRTTLKHSLKAIRDGEFVFHKVRDEVKSAYRYRAHHSDGEERSV